MDYNFLAVFKYWDAFGYGLLTTAKLTALCFVLGTTLGFILSQLRVSAIGPVRWLTSLYVEFFRGTPVLVQLFWVFYCLPLILGLELSNFVSASITLSLYMGAITSETFRSSMKTIGPEQKDAGIALGLSRLNMALFVTLPQVVMRSVPMLLSNGVALFKESALISAVGMADLMFIGQSISNRTARPVEVFTIVAIIYFVLAFPLTRAVGLVERRVLARLSA